MDRDHGRPCARDERGVTIQPGGSVATGGASLMVVTGQLAEAHWMPMDMTHSTRCMILDLIEEHIQRLVIKARDFHRNVLRCLYLI